MAQPPRSGGISDRLRRLPVRWREGLAAGALAALLLVAAGRSSLWDRDEPRFARATVEMVRSGDYLVPTFDGRVRPDKPILVYWLMSVPVRLFGTGERAVRALSSLALAAAAWMTAVVGRRLLGVGSPLLAMVVLALTPLTAAEGTLATTDALLLAFTTLSTTVFAHAFYRGWRPRLHLPALTLGFGAALLAKGPVGLIPLLSMLVTFALGRRLTPLRGRHLLGVGTAALGGVALFLAWGIPADRASGGVLAAQGLGHHVLERSLTPLESHGGPWLLFLPYYPLVLLLTFFPWTLYLPAAVSAVAGGRIGGERGRALLAGWVLPVFALMTLVATKLPHYVLPAWPGLALAVTATVAVAERGGLTARDRRWLRRGGLLTVPVGVAAGLALASTPFLTPVTARPAFLTAGAILVATPAAAATWLRAGRHRRSLSTLLIGSGLFYLLLFGSIVPAVDAVQIAPRLARAVRSAVPPGVPVSAFGYTEPGLVFYLDQGPVEMLDDWEEVEGWTRRPGPGLLILPTRDLARLRSAGPSPELSVVTRVEGLNPAHGRWETEAAVARGFRPTPPPGVQ